MSDKFRFRRAESPSDAQRLKAHFSKVFFEGVGIFVETQFNFFPRMKNEYWFIAENSVTKEIVSAFLLMPWVWEIEGIRLKVAQMAGAATLPEYRHRGLIRELIKHFEQALFEDEFDLAVINGIGGFYRQFGYCYTLPVENHVNLQLDLIPDMPTEPAYTYRLAEESDIPFLIKQDEAYRERFSISAVRDEAAWKYLLNDRFHTMFGSEFWLMEHKGNGQEFYFRIPLNSHFGGKGLLVSEISESIHEEALNDLFSFCKRKAIERQKPFIRLNLHTDSKPVQRAKAMGASVREHAAWQVKIPDPACFLTKMTPLLEKRISETDLNRFTGTFRLDFFKINVDLLWEEGRLVRVSPGEGRQKHSVRVHSQLFPTLCLGYRNLSELKRIWPDIGPTSEKSTHLFETLFPLTQSWLYEPA